MRLLTLSLGSLLPCSAALAQSGDAPKYIP